MKRFTSAIILLGFFLLNFSQLGLIVSYLNNKEFIAKNLCEKRAEEVNECEGKCHLAQQIVEEEESKEKDIPEFKVKENEVFFFNVIKFKFNFHNKEVFYPLFVLPQNTQNFFTSVFQPPET